MRRLTMLVALMLTAGLCMAGDQRRETITVNVGTNAADTATNVLSGITGDIDEILIDLISGPTGSVVIAVVPELTTLSARNVYTNTALTADAVLRPKVQGTDVGGAVISGEYDKIRLYNEGLRVTWASDNSTGLVGKVIIKISKEQ